MLPNPLASGSAAARLALLLAVPATAVACTSSEPEPGLTDVTAYVGARVITGTDAAPIENAVFLVSNGRFTRVGSSSEVEVPDGAVEVDLTGKTVIPGLVNAHVHLASTRDERIEQLEHMAFYGASAVVSLGLDEGGVPYRIRDERPAGTPVALSAGQGITAPEPGRTEVPSWVTTEDEARAAVQDLASQGVDIVKIWVDDRGGQYDKLTPELYGAVIDEAHTHGLMVTAHVFTLEDAKGLLAAGVDAFAHGVRDQDVDDEIVAAWTSRPDVVLVPNLPGPGVPVDLSWIETVPEGELAEMQSAQVARPEAQESFGIQARNLARLGDAGVRIAFGTDGSVPWAVHLEMEDMVRSGMTPAEVIVAATSTSAGLMGLNDLGAVAPGMSADFVVLDANPLDDITNTRRIDAVYLRGSALDRDGLATRLRGGAAQ